MVDLDERVEREQVNPAQAMQREELSDKLETKPTEGSGLEQKTNGFFDTLRSFSLWDWAKLGATSLLAFSIAGPMNWIVTTGSYIAAYATINRKKIEKNELKTQMHLGNFITPALYYMFNILNTFNPVKKIALGLSVAMPMITAMIYSSEHVIRKYTPSKFIKDTLTLKTLRLPGEIYRETLKPKFFKTLKNLYLFFAPVFGAIIYLVPLQYQIASTAAARYVNRMVIGKTSQKIDTQKQYNNAPYQQPAYRPT